MSNKVSVIIAAFNAQTTLAAALESALSQIACDVEVLVVDDCSTDATLDIAKQFAEQDDRVRVMQTPHNLGPSAARNQAIEVARGDWLAVLDADDRMAPERLSTLLNIALCKQLDMVMDSYYMCPTIMSPHSGARLTDLCASGELLPISLPAFIHLGLGSTKPLLRKSLLESNDLRFDANVRCGEDLLLYAQVVAVGARSALLNRPMYYRTEAYTSLSRRDRIGFLSGLLDVFALLQHSLTAKDASNCAVTKAINYRQRVTKDALTAARWKLWLSESGSVIAPSIASLFGLFRHLCLRKTRYAISE